MVVRIITDEEIIRVNFTWELKDLRPESEEKSPVFEIIGREKKKTTWGLSSKLQGNNLLINLEFSSACRSVIQYNFQVCDVEEEKFEIHRGWGSGDFIRRQGLIVSKNSLSKIKIFCKIICKLNVRMDEPEIPECQLIDELNFLFEFKNTKQKSLRTKLNSRKRYVEHDENNNQNTKVQLLEDSICNKKAHGFDSSNNLGSNSGKYEDSVSTQMIIENAIAQAVQEHVTGFSGRNIYQILAITSLQELELENPKLAATFLRVVLNMINNFTRILETLKGFLHLQ